VLLGAWDAPGRGRLGWAEGGAQPAQASPNAGRVILTGPRLVVCVIVRSLVHVAVCFRS